WSSDRQAVSDSTGSREGVMGSVRRATVREDGMGGTGGGGVGGYRAAGRRFHAIAGGRHGFGPTSDRARRWDGGDGGGGDRCSSSSGPLVRRCRPEGLRPAEGG